MVEIIGTHRLSEVQEGPKRRAFPQDELSRIQKAVESVPEEVFLNSEHGDEVSEFDHIIGQNLSEYSVEGSDECILWDEDGFYLSVDLYHPKNRIAIELEKSSRKYVWKDLVKFARGGHTDEADTKTVNFGCAVVPDYYSDSPVFSRTRKMLKFMEPLFDLDDIVIIGFDRPVSE